MLGHAALLANCSIIAVVEAEASYAARPMHARTTPHICWYGFADMSTQYRVHCEMSEFAHP